MLETIEKVITDLSIYSNPTNNPKSRNEFIWSAYGTYYFKEKLLIDQAPAEIELLHKLIQTIHFIKVGRCGLEILRRVLDARYLWHKEKHGTHILASTDMQKSALLDLRKKRLIDFNSEYISKGTTFFVTPSKKLAKDVFWPQFSSRKNSLSILEDFILAYHPKK